MRKFLSIAVLLLSGAVTSGLAQGGAPPRPQAPAPQSGPASVTKIAVIYSAEFRDAKTGLARFSATIAKVDGEFTALQNELNQTAARLRGLQTEILNMQKANPPIPPAQIQAKIDSLDLQKRDYQRKGEDAKASYERRLQDLLTPLQEDVGKALNNYAKTRGITMIIDATQVPLVYAADSIDITKAFIADYNSKNPATAAATTPR